MSYVDRILVCRDCSNSFTFTSGEQSFYAARGLMNDPQRCPAVAAPAAAAPPARLPRPTSATARSPASVVATRARCTPPSVPPAAR